MKPAPDTAAAALDAKTGTAIVRSTAAARTTTVPIDGGMFFRSTGTFTEDEDEILLPMNGVADGIRTHDDWNHNPGLYR